VSVAKSGKSCQRPNFYLREFSRFRIPDFFAFIFPVNFADGKLLHD
jgi:hypothetical protein